MPDYNKLRSTKQSLPAQRKSRPTPPAESAAAAARRGGYTRDHSVSLKIGADLFDRMEGALNTVPGQIGCRTKAEFVRKALDTYLDGLEAEYNAGAPFDGALRSSAKKKSA